MVDIRKRIIDPIGNEEEEEEQEEEEDNQNKHVDFIVFFFNCFFS
jgi:hypothetical protein